MLGNFACCEMLSAFFFSKLTSKKKLENNLDTPICLNEIMQISATSINFSRKFTVLK